ncbi:hypothetical protein M758_11G105400 [Ceratodon purpureus]|nr:hypothetical protein M758_11G105400 [Ceratodon purpureus]
MAMSTQLTRCWIASCSDRFELGSSSVRSSQGRKRHCLQRPGGSVFMYDRQRHTLHGQKSKLFLTLPRLAAEGEKQRSLEVACSDPVDENRDGNDGSRKAQDDGISRDGQMVESFVGGSVRAESGDENGGMDCIGTGMEVECVVSFKEGDVNESGKLAGRAKNDVVGQSKNDEGEMDATLVESVLSTLLLISPFFFWGTAMVAMKGILPKAGPMFVAATRLIPAGALLVGFASSRGKKLPSGSTAWIAIALFGLIDASCFQGFLAEGLRRTSAGLGSVIIDSQPLTVAVLASLLFGETLGPVAIVGLGLGVVGLVLLEVPLEVLQSVIGPGEMHQLVQSTSSSDQLAEVNWSIWDSGEWWMLLAAQSMAVGTVMVRWVSKFSDPVMATGWHMILGGLPLLALSVWQRDPALSGHIQDLSAGDWGALFYTSLFGSAISYGVFFYNATRGNLTKLSSLTFLTPMFAAFFGYLILDEKLNGLQLLGASVTLLSIYLVNRKVQPDSGKTE